MHNKIISGLPVFGLAMCMAGASSQASAAGFALIEHSASGQGNAYAGAAAIAEDASTVWFNPAGMMRLKNDHIVVASHIIMPDSAFTNNGSTGAAALGSQPLTGKDDDGGFNALVANFFYVSTIDENTKFGFGINTPFGLAVKYDDNWVGRYHAVESDLKTINFNPSIAITLTDDLSIGAGINFMIADVKLTSAVDFGALFGVPQQADGFADLEGDNFDDVATGVNFGILYDLSDATRLGVAYRSKVTLNIDGDANFTVPSSAAFITATGLFADSGLKAQVTLPETLAVSVAHDMDSLTLLGDVTWYGWHSFQELRIVYDNPLQPDSVTTEEWDDTLRISLGADYRYSNDLTLRAGIAYDETPVPSAERRTPRLPGDSRKWVSIGATYLVDKEFIVDVGYSHLMVDETQINNTFESSQAVLAATLTGSYDASVDIFSAQLRWNY